MIESRVVAGGPAWTGVPGAIAYQAMGSAEFLFLSSAISGAREKARELGIEGRHLVDWEINLSKQDLDDIMETAVSVLVEQGAEVETVYESRTLRGNGRRIACIAVRKGDAAAMMILLCHGGEHFGLDGFGDSEQIYEWAQKIQERVAEAGRPKRTHVNIDAMWMGSHGSDSRTIQIETPELQDIRTNYSQDTWSSVQSFISLAKSNEHPGKLAIWHGPPGTGKTFLIRSLARELDDKFSMVMVTDPEILMESSPYYYDAIADRDKPVIFVLEDAADGLLKDSRLRYGSRISRFLNITDGLVSRGRRDLFLVTFNEEIAELDPAIIRPGRCMNITCFHPFSPAEARAWVKERGYSIELEAKNYSLAELYSMVAKEDQLHLGPTYQSPKSRSIGFVR